MRNEAKGTGTVRTLRFPQVALVQAVNILHIGHNCCGNQINAANERIVDWEFSDLCPIILKVSFFSAQASGCINEYSVVKPAEQCDMVKRSSTISTQRGTSSCIYVWIPYQTLGVGEKSVRSRYLEKSDRTDVVQGSTL